MKKVTPSWLHVDKCSGNTALPGRPPAARLNNVDFGNALTTLSWHPFVTTAANFGPGMPAVLGSLRAPAGRGKTSPACRKAKYTGYGGRRSKLQW
jgi:hypothetical protein